MNVDGETDLAEHSSAAASVREPEAASAGLHKSATSLTRQSWLLIALISVVLLIPCFWLPKIEAGDLASHVYNAWLASLVVKGQAPGISIAPQTNNILADVLLLKLGVALGFAAAEKIVTGFAVLLFFWSSFALVSAFAKQLAWPFVPLLAMFAYGWTFHMGFLNFYLALGFSFVGLAILWSMRVRSWWILIPLAGLIWMAHPLGFLWFLGAGAYLVAVKFLPARWHWVPFTGAVLAVFALRTYLVHRYETVPWGGHIYALNGTDQIRFVGDERYPYVAMAVLLVVGGWLLSYLWKIRSHAGGWKSFLSVPLQLFLIGLVTLPFFPDFVMLPQYAEPVGFLCLRFSLTIAILGCCALSAVRPGMIFAVITACIAIAFFSLVYRDAARTWRMEQQAQALVKQLPEGARVMSTIFRFHGSPMFVHHVVDRACIGRCFSVDNYEPYTKQFRLRAAVGNRIVSASAEDANHMAFGDYLVRDTDLPTWQIFQCGPTEIDLCARPLHPGSLLNFIPSEAIRGRKVQ